MPALARARGFTLPELLTVLAVMAILGMLAAPSYTGLMASMRARSAGTDLYTALNRARSEAIKRNMAVTLAPSGEAGWQDGWNIADPRDADRLLDDYPAVAGAAIVGPASVVYLPNGRVRAANPPSFTIRMAGSDTARCVALDLSGRPSQTDAAC